MTMIQRLHRHRRYRCFNLTAIVAASHHSLHCAAFAPPLRVADNAPRCRPSTPRTTPVGDRRLPTRSHAPPPTVADERRLQQGQSRRLRLLFAFPDDADRGTQALQQYIRPYIKQLFLLCRPINFPIVALFHALGVHQAARLWASTLAAAPNARLPLLGPLLTQPSMVMVLLALLLVTSTSMITNDYYDAKHGVDAAASGTAADADENAHYHPLAQGEVPFPIAKTFDSYLYALLLLTSAFVPGAPSRLLVLGGAITTYLYTMFLKPRTWVKNLSCAALVAMSPVTSGLAAWHVLCDGTFLKSLGAGDVGVDTAGAAMPALPFHLIFRSPLSFLVVALFAGIMSREILMDITDCEGDAQAGIETVPVKYGKSAGACVALGCSCVSAISACGSSLMRMVEGGGSLRFAIAIPSLSSLANSQSRSVLLSVAGSGMLLWRTFGVWKTKGEDATLCERAIRESLISVLLVLASFL